MMKSLYSLLTRIIQRISRETIHAVTGKEAVETCRRNPDIDLVLMDIRMPEMNGCEATTKIRQFNPEVIIIAQTAYGFTGDREIALAAGCTDYISKPIDEKLLFQIIKGHMNRTLADA
ncbi:MAG: response regulator [Bacteroidales bacterium]